MRQLVKILFFIFFAANLYAQTPTSFHYQAVVRDPAGSPIASKNVSFRISILTGAATGNSLYTETHAVTTNEFGVVNLTIGTGRINGNDNLGNINWGSVTPFLKIEVDLQGGENFELMGTSQLLSVPYAFHAKTSDHAKTADNGFSGEYRDLKNAPDLTSLDNSPTNEIQTISRSGNTVTLSKGGGSFALPAVPTYTAGSGITISTANRISVTATPRVNIGDIAHGGIVFYVNPSGTHGLVLNQSFQGSVNWYDAHNLVQDPALTGGEFTDWRLPSLAECKLIQFNLINPGIVTMDSKLWTGTEVTTKADGFTDEGNSAINFTMSPFNTIASNYTFQNPKSSRQQVRAVRSF